MIDLTEISFKKHGWQVGSILLVGGSIYWVQELVFMLKYRQYSIDWQRSKVLTVLLLATLICAGLWTLKRYLNQYMAWTRSYTCRFGWQLFSYNAWVLLIMLGLRNIGLRNWLYTDASFINLADEGMIALISVLLVTVVVSADLGIYLLNRWRMSLAQLERFKKENIEFHLEMLKTQVNPHFLFNSLNTLSSLIYSDPDTAAEFVRQLAKVYRYVLENRTKELVSLEEELTFLQAYTYLMDLRFGQSLSIRIQLPPSTHSYAIAPLTLQMLIENAIKHNIVSQKKPLDIHIFQEEADYLTVQNPLQLKPVKEFSSEIGLKNIHSRYGFITRRQVEVQQTDLFFRVKIPLLKTTETLLMQV